MRQKQKQTVKQSVKQSVIINLEKRKRRPRAKKQVKQTEPGMVRYYPMQISYPPNPMSMFTQEQFSQKMDTLKAEILEKVKKEPVAMPVSKYLEQHDDERYLKSVGEVPPQISVFNKPVSNPSNEEISLASLGLLGHGIPRQRSMSDLTEGTRERSFGDLTDEAYYPSSQFKPEPILYEPSLSALVRQPSLSSLDTPARSEIQGERIFDPVPVYNPFVALSPEAIEVDLDEPDVRLEDVYQKPKGRPKGSVNRPKEEIQLEKKMKDLKKASRNASRNPLGTEI
jgi:hypothetical protein